MKAFYPLPLIFALLLSCDESVIKKGTFKKISTIKSQTGVYGYEVEHFEYEGEKLSMVRWETYYRQDTSAEFKLSAEGVRKYKYSNGVLTHIEDSQGTVMAEFSYKDGRLAGIETSVSNYKATSSYAYDANGKIGQITKNTATHSSDGHSIRKLEWADFNVEKEYYTNNYGPNETHHTMVYEYGDHLNVFSDPTYLEYVAYNSFKGHFFSRNNVKKEEVWFEQNFLYEIEYEYEFDEDSYPTKTFYTDTYIGLNYSIEIEYL